MLIDFDGTLLFVSHDRYFINRGTSSKVMEISEDGATIYLEITITTLRRRRAWRVGTSWAEENQVSEKSSSFSRASDYQLKKPIKKMRKLSRRIEQIENELETIEATEEISAMLPCLKQMMAELSDLQKSWMT